MTGRFRQSRGENEIIVVWIVLIGVFLVSIISLIEGIRNRSRFIFAERIKYYLIGFLVPCLILIFVTLSSSNTDMDVGLIITLIVMFTLIFGNLLYYTKIEQLKNILEIKFRMLKYLLLSFILLFLSAIIFNVIK